MKNGSIGNTDYIRFGSGAKNLVILPGLGDSLRTVKGTALPMSVAYSLFSAHYTVYMFSRKNDLSKGATTRDMAHDLKLALDALEVYKADMLGVSMGGMIAQWFAIDYPEALGRLVLAVTSARPNPVLLESLDEWMDCARRNDHTALMESNLRRIYSEAYCKKNGWLVPVMGRLTKPKSYDRFFVQSHACYDHNAFPELHRVTAPTLVIGGEQDLSLGGDASREIAAAIPGAKLHMYEQWGHGLYEEAKDFQAVVLKFLTMDKQTEPES